MDLKTWVLTSFGLDSINARSVSDFIGFDLSTHDLSNDELIWILLFDVVDSKKYSSLQLSKKEKFFLATLHAELEDMMNSLEIGFDLYQLWELA